MTTLVSEIVVTLNLNYVPRQTGERLERRETGIQVLGSMEGWPNRSGRKEIEHRIAGC